MVQVERPVAAVAAPVEPTEAAPAQPAPIPEPVAESAAPIAEPPVAASVPEEALPQPEVPAGSWFANYKLLGLTVLAFVAGAAVAGVSSFFRDDPAENRQATPAIQTQQEVVEPTATATGLTTEPAADLTAASPETEIAADIVEATPVENQEIDGAASTADIDKPEVEPTTATVEPAVEQESAEEVPKVALRFDPLDFDPENLDLGAINRADTKATVKPPVEAKALPDGPVATKELPSTLPSVRRDMQQTVTPAVAEEKLSQKFPALKIKKMALGDFLRFVSRMAAVPVSIAPEELQMAGITARREVSLDVKEANLNEALRNVLGPLHLEHVVEGPLVRVVRKGGSKLREVTYPLDDLSSTASVEEVAEWVEQLVAPTEWQAVGGEGKLQLLASSLKIKQTQRVQYELLIFLERLRLANELLPRSRFPIKQLSSKPAHMMLASRLEAPTVFTFSRFTALQEIVRHWQAELGVPVIVDWPALAEADLWPQSRIICSIDNQPWHVALSEVLAPLGLGWRATAGEMLEITTSQKVQTQPVLELYTLSQAPDTGADRLLAELTSVAKVQTSDADGVGPTAVEYDSSSHVLFVLQPASAQRSVWNWLVRNRLLAAE